MGEDICNTEVRRSIRENKNNSFLKCSQWEEVLEGRFERNSGHGSDYSEEETGPERLRGLIKISLLVCSRAETKSSVFNMWPFPSSPPSSCQLLSVETTTKSKKYGLTEQYLGQNT